jgi:hypothetical protein
MKSEQEYIERAEDMAETAQKLAEQHDEQNNSVNEPTLMKVPVVGTENKNEGSVNFVINIGHDEQKTVTVPWPDDTTDASEPLVRLVQFYNINMDDITELKKIWVYTKDGGDYDVVIPPKDFDSFIENPNSKNIILNNNRLYAVESIKRSILKVFVCSAFSALLLYAILTNVLVNIAYAEYIFIAILSMNIYYIIAKIEELNQTTNKNIGKMSKS